MAATETAGSTKPDKTHIHPPSLPPFLPPQDYAKLTEEEMAATETAGSTKPDKAHTTFIPHSHPFAHARLLNVVVGTEGRKEGGKEGGRAGCIRLRQENRNVRGPRETPTGGKTPCFPP